MKTSLLSLAASASIVAAQATTSAYVGNTICAMDILDSCIATETLNVSACEANDWSCLCNAYTLVLGCYNDCPSDPSRFGAQQQQVANCDAANAYDTTTSSAVAAATGTAAPAGTKASHRNKTGATAAPTGSATGTGASAASATSTAGAATIAVPAGGFILGLLGLFL